MTEIIDAWMQIPDRSFLRNPLFESLRRWPTAWQGLAEQDRDIGCDEVLEGFSAQGVAKVFASAWVGPQGELISNESVALAVQRRPEQVFGIASVDIRQPMTAVRELRRCVRKYGFKGLRILPWLWGLPPDDRRFYPLYAECIELDVTLCTQVGHAGPLMPSGPGRPIPYLDSFGQEVPGLRLVRGHIGCRWPSEMLSLMMRYTKLWWEAYACKPGR